MMTFSLLTNDEDQVQRGRRLMPSNIMTMKTGVQDADFGLQVRQLVLHLVWGKLTDCRSTLVILHNLGASLFLSLSM